MGEWRKMTSAATLDAATSRADRYLAMIWVWEAFGGGDPRIAPAMLAYQHDVAPTPYAAMSHYKRYARSPRHGTIANQLLAWATQR